MVNNVFNETMVQYGTAKLFLVCTCVLLNVLMYYLIKCIEPSMVALNGLLKSTACTVRAAYVPKFIKKELLLLESRNLFPNFPHHQEDLFARPASWPATNALTGKKALVLLHSIALQQNEELLFQLTKLQLPVLLAHFSVEEDCFSLCDDLAKFFFGCGF